MKPLAYSFLFLYVSLTELYLGSLAMLAFRALVPAAWIEPLVPAAARAQKLGWVLAPLFLLLILLAPTIYPWFALGPGGSGFRALYLSRGGFVVRGIAYWVLWLGLSRAALARRPWTGGPGMVLILLSATFAGVDWVLSLEPQFGSTAFGLIFVLSSLLLAFGFTTFARAAGAGPGERQDQGSVHLALICTWTYVAFMQFLVVWSGNLPREVGWYEIRARHGWQWVPIGLGALQFFLPLILLFQSRLKRSPAFTRAIALFTVGWQLAFVFWQILPELRPSLSLAWSDAVALAIFAAAVFRLRKEEHEPARA